MIRGMVVPPEFEKIKYNAGKNGLLCTKHHVTSQKQKIKTIE